RRWLSAVPTVVVSPDVADLTEPELRQEVLKLRPTRPEACGVAPPRAGPAAGVRMHRVARATARRTRQEANPARRRSGPRVHAVAGAPAVRRTSGRLVPRNGVSERRGKPSAIPHPYRCSASDVGGAGPQWNVQ